MGSPSAPTCESRGPSPRLRPAAGRGNTVDSRDGVLPFDAVVRYTLRYGIR